MCSVCIMSALDNIAQQKQSPFYWRACILYVMILQNIPWQDPGDI